MVEADGKKMRRCRGEVNAPSCQSTPARTSQGVMCGQRSRGFWGKKGNRGVDGVDVSRDPPVVRGLFKKDPQTQTKMRRLA